MEKQEFLKITSTQNSQIQLLKKLALKKYRRSEKLFVGENLAIIHDALAAGHDFKALFVTGDFLAKHPDQIKYLQDNSQSQKYYLIDEKINKHYSQLDAPSGITAVYNIKDRELVSGSVIYLNGVNDPGNLGAIMRSALSFGFLNLVLDETCADIYNAKVISAAKDSLFKLNIIEDGDGLWLKKNKLPLYITSSHQGKNLKSFHPTEKFCLVLGSESHGISPKIMNLATESIKIEMLGLMESLNVAAAAAILFYELSR